MTRTRQWTLGAVAVIVVIALAGWFLLVQRERAHAADVKALTDAQVATNAGLTTQIVVLKQQNKNLPQQEAKLAKLREKIPTSAQMPTLITELSAAADQAGVDLLTVTPSTPTSTVPTTSATGAAILTPNQLAYVDLELTFQGGFYESEEYVAGLEKLQRAMLISNLSLSSQDSTKSVLLQGSVTARVFLSPTELPTSTEIPGVVATPTPTPTASTPVQ